MLIDRKQTLEEGRIRVPFVSTVDNYADFWTAKPNKMLASTISTDYPHSMACG